MDLRSGTSPPPTPSPAPPLVWEAPGAPMLASAFFIWGSHQGGQGSGASGEGRLGKAGSISAAETARVLPGGAWGLWLLPREAWRHFYGDGGRGRNWASPPLAAAPTWLRWPHGRADTERLPFSTQIWDMSDDETV